MSRRSWAEYAERASAEEGRLANILISRFFWFRVIMWGTALAWFPMGGLFLMMVWKNPSPERTGPFILALIFVAAPYTLLCFQRLLFYQTCVMQDDDEQLRETYIRLAQAEKEHKK